jgi:XrtJ-associated TM-motif-TM protein
MKKLATTFSLAVLFLLASTLRAQNGNGCVDSPEDPTLALGILAVITAMVFAGLRMRNNSNLKRPQ